MVNYELCHRHRYYSKTKNEKKIPSVLLYCCCIPGIASSPKPPPNQSACYNTYGGVLLFGASARKGFILYTISFLFISPFCFCFCLLFLFSFGMGFIFSWIRWCVRCAAEATQQVILMYIRISYNTCVALCIFCIIFP